MSENKNQSEFSTPQRLLTIAGLASIAITGNAVSPEHADEVERTSITTEQAIISSDSPHGIVDIAPVGNIPFDQPASPYKKSITIKLPDTNILPFQFSSNTEQQLPLQGTSEITLPTIEKVSLHPENMTVSKEVKAIMDRDTVYISGCSGSIVRSRLGEALGIVTAEHCGYRGNGDRANTRIIGGDGQSYILTGAPIEAKTGSDVANLKSVGVIKELFVPAKNDTSLDIAFGAFSGHTSKEVAAAYNHNKLSAKGLSKLKLGDRMYISGWPVDQPNNKGNFERQDFPLSYLGEEMVTTSGNEKIHMIWAAVPTSKDGADCSFGNSGGKAFVIDGVHSRSVGVLAAFIDFTGKLWGDAANGENERKKFENRIGVDLSPYYAICGIATETPSVENGGEVIKPVTNYKEIPGYKSYVELINPTYAEALIQKAHNEFFDPNITKTWVSGAINLDPNGKGYWKMDPAIFYDKKSGGAVIATFTDNTKDGLELNYIADFKNQKFYGYPELHSISGELEVFSGLFGPDGFSSIDGGAIFGHSQTDPNAIRIIQESPTFGLYFDDATQSLQIMQNK